MRIFSFYFWFIQLPLVLFFFFIVWFIPWIFVLHFGILFYFPYRDDGKTRFLRITGPAVSLFSKSWVNGKSIPNACKAALIASEDTHFYEHNGVDFKSINKIVKNKKASQQKKRGGSTITQQLVKNAFLSRDRNYVRKAREVVGALLLDATLAKDRQIEWYLNVVEFGQNTYGLENAAQRYFKVSAPQLSPAQCVALITILPSPRKWNQSLENKKLTHFFIQRYKQISTNLLEMNIASTKEKIDISHMNLGFNMKKELGNKKVTLKTRGKNFEKAIPPQKTREAQEQTEPKKDLPISPEQQLENTDKVNEVKGIDSNESLNDIENTDG